MVFYIQNSDGVDTGNIPKVELASIVIFEFPERNMKIVKYCSIVFFFLHHSRSIFNKSKNKSMAMQQKSDF